MTSTIPGNDDQFIAVHVCKSCGAATERPDVNVDIRIRPLRISNAKSFPTSCSS
jgi:hypothetical protein